jgi:hypothetical protein
LARAYYADVVLDQFGNPIAGASIHVYNVNAVGAQTGDAAIYISETGVAKSNPFLTTADGFYEFWVTPGARYDVNITATGFTARTVRFDADYVGPRTVPVADLDATGSTTGFVLTVQSDGSIAAAAAGVPAGSATVDDIIALG